MLCCSKRLAWFNFFVGPHCAGIDGLSPSKWRRESCFFSHCWSWSERGLSFCLATTTCACSWGLVLQPLPSSCRLVFVWYEACMKIDIIQSLVFKISPSSTVESCARIILCLHIIYTSGSNWHIWGFAFCLTGCQRGETLLIGRLNSSRSACSTAHLLGVDYCSNISPVECLPSSLNWLSVYTQI